jgi:glycosyltransferase involved in cell wall biosynthesis
MKTIGLCMIVKNEAKVICRCLASVLPLVDYVLVVDTGSEDGTQQIIRTFLTSQDVRGAVIDEPWQDFAYNRSFALAKLREVEDIDYGLVIDADDIVVVDDGFDSQAFKAQLEHDSYEVQVTHGGISHFRTHIFSNRQPFFYRGVLHEYLEVASTNLTSGRAMGFSIHANASMGGGRSENPRKYHDDAALLERALAIETDPFLISRYTFYLAQSYRDCGEREKALANYIKRAELGHWNEEVYISLLEAGNLMTALQRPFEEVMATYERAYQTIPTRAEAPYAAGHYCRMLGKNIEGYKHARRGVELTPPASGLFVQRWVYDFGLLDEFAINAYWAGAYRDSLDASLKLLASDKLPLSMVKRVVANAGFAAARLPAEKKPNLGTLGAESLIDQHRLAPQRALRSRVSGPPLVLVAILAKQKEPALALYLECIEALSYPKSSIILYIRTNNNTDRTEQILREWVKEIGHLYAAVEFDGSDVADRVEQYREHEWNAERFKVLGRIRNASLRRALELGCDFYFVADVDNFIRPDTLRELVALNMPIVAPLLRSIIPDRFYSNYHAEIDATGYYENCDQYHWLLNRHVRGIVEVPVVHCTYLIRADVIPELNYEDESGRHEYVIFSDVARKAAIPQYLDNRQVYGYITFSEGDCHLSDGIERSRELLRAEHSGCETTADILPSPSGNGAVIQALPGLPPAVITISGGNAENPLAKLVKSAFEQAQAGRGRLDKRLLSFPGASGRRFRLFINALVGSLKDARYLEIGSYTGSTLSAAIFGNSVTAMVIDNWSQFGGPVRDFMHNVATFRGPAARVSVLESDFRAVDYQHIGKFNVYLFDGPHTERDHYDALNLVLPALDNTFVLVVDDWDWGQVRSGTLQAIRDNGLNMDVSIEIRTTMDGTTPPIGGEQSDWHNGYLLAVVSGNSRMQ